MMVLCFDLESTGLDTSEARITEVGACLWDCEKQSPVLLLSKLVNPKIAISEEAAAVSGISQALAESYGVHIEDALEELNYMAIKGSPAYLVGHNILNFDFPLLKAEADRCGKGIANLRSLPIIDTRIDLPYKTPPRSLHLGHLAMDAGFLNPFAHRALFDALSTLKVMSQFPMEEIIAQQAIPMVTMRACVSYEQRELAKAQRYNWEKLDDKTYPKMWVKKLRQNMVDAEVMKCAKSGFQSVILNG